MKASLFHVHEQRLAPGELVCPGRWGQKIAADGNRHPLFQREERLERWRIEKTSIGISRLNCTFAFDDEETAGRYAAMMLGQFVHRVVPIDLNAPFVRVDMMWVTWIGEANSTDEQIAKRCDSYWSGRATADLMPHVQIAWELLFPCSLKVV